MHEFGMFIFCLLLFKLCPLAHQGIYTNYSIELHLASCLPFLHFVSSLNLQKLTKRRISILTHSNTPFSKMSNLGPVYHPTATADAAQTVAAHQEAREMILWAGRVTFIFVQRKAKANTDD